MRDQQNKYSANKLMCTWSSNLWTAPVCNALKLRILVHESETIVQSLEK